jgi:hypothetical protein
MITGLKCWLSICFYKLIVYSLSGKKINMIKSLINTSGVLSSVLLVGCVSTPLKQNLPAQQAMTQAYAQLYKVPNYQFSGQMKVDQIELKPRQQPAASSGTTSTLETKQQALSTDSATQLPAEEKQRADDTLKSSTVTRDKKFDDIMQRMIQVYGERYRFNYYGVVDLRHQQIEITPEFRYEARNMAGYVRVPMMADLANAKLYADLSALSPWLVNPESEGKYTRFDWAKYQDKIHVNQFFEMLRDTALASYQLGEAGYFKDVALTAQDTQTGAVRKIQFQTPLSHYMAKLTTFVAMNKQGFQQAIIKDNVEQKTQAGTAAAKDKLDAAVPEKPAQGRMDAATVQAMIQHDPTAYNTILTKLEEKLDPASSLTQQALLDKHGRVIQSDWLMDIVSKDAEKYKVKLKLSNQLKFSNYGNASVAYQPKAGNWIDVKSSMDNTLFGTLFNKGLSGLSGSGLAGLDKDLGKLETKQPIGADKE